MIMLGGLRAAFAALTIWRSMVSALLAAPRILRLSASNQRLTWGLPMRSSRSVSRAGRSWRFTMRSTRLLQPTLYWLQRAGNHSSMTKSRKRGTAAHEDLLGDGLEQRIAGRFRLDIPVVAQRGQHGPGAAARFGLGHDCRIADDLRDPMPFWARADVVEGRATPEVAAFHSSSRERRTRFILVPDLVGWRRERMPDYPHTAWFEAVPDWA